MKKAFFLLTFIFVQCLAFSQTTRFVDLNATGSGSGTSWTNAYTDLQAAIDASTSGDSIFVTDDTYLPTTIAGGGSDNRDKAFILKSGIGLYGGFKGSESHLSERDTTMGSWNYTQLSGDLGTISDSSDNSYHVLLAINLSGSTILDGFGIFGGYADDSSTHTVNSAAVRRDFGGGLYNIGSDLKIANSAFQGMARAGGGGMNNENAGTVNISDSYFGYCRIYGNNPDDFGGGGMRNYNSSPSLVRCYFSFNRILNVQGGGGMRNEMNSKPDLDQVDFESNQAENGDGGAGMYNASGSAPMLFKVTFQSNYTANQGAGIYNDNSKPVLDSVTFQFNSADGGGGAMENDGGSDAVITNTIFELNYTMQNGGAIQNWKSSPVLMNCQFEFNFATGDAGAIYNYTDCSPSISNTNFSLNVAGGNGGAIYNRRGCNPILTNLLIQRNNAGGYGGGAYTVSSNGSPCSPIGTNLTLVNNRADSSGGGSYDDGQGNTKLRNSIISGNYSPGVDDADAPASLAATALFRCIIGTDYYVNGTTTPTTVSGNIFVDTNISDYRLAVGSMAIDIGDSTYFNLGKTPDLSALKADLKGGNRVIGSNIDLGAYEVCSDTSTLALSLNISPGQSVPFGSQVIFTAVQSGGGSNPTFVWKRNGILINNSGSAYTATAGVDFKDGDVIQVKMYSSNACSATSTILSEPKTMSVTTGVSEIVGKDRFRIYPNPSSGSFYIEAKDLESIRGCRFRIYDVNGSILMEDDVSSPRQLIYLPPSCQSGLYMIRIFSPDLDWNQKLLLER